LIAVRRSRQDAGRRLPQQSYRTVRQLIQANFKRVQEATRVVEEYARVVAPRAVMPAKRIRFAVYDLEQEVETFLRARARKG